MYQLPRGMNMEPKRQVFGWDDHERPKRDAGQALQATHLDGLASLDEASALSSSYALPRFVRDHAPPASGPGAWTVGKSRARTRELRRSSSDSLRSGGGGAYWRYPSGERVEALALRPPVDLVDSSMRAEVSLATASAMREKALLDYREARCKGAAWLWLRATKRAGGSRTIALMTLHLWHNYCVSSIARRAQVEEIVHRYDMRRKRFMIRQWLRAAKKQRRERQLEMEKVMREAELFEAKEATRVAEARAEDLNRRVESLERALAAARAREVSDEERERIAVERAEDRARGDRAEEALLVMVGAAATIVPAALANAQRGLFRLRTPAEVAADEGARRGSVLQQQAEAKRLAELSASGFDVAEEQSVPRWTGAPKYPDLRGVLEPETIAKLALPRALDLPKTAAEELAAADAGGAPVEEHRPDDLAEEILLAFANHQSLHAGAGGARAAAVESLPTYQEMTNWKTAFVDGRQLARIVFAELEALLPARAVKGVERAEGVNLKGRKTLLGYRGTGPRLWQRGVDQGALQSFASDVRGRLDRPNDLAKLLEKVAREDLGLPPGLLHADDLRRRDVDWHFAFLAHLFSKGGSRLIDHDQDIAPDGVVGKYRYTKREMAKVRDRWARLRADLEVPAPDPELPDEDLIPLLPKSAIAKLLPPPAAMQTAEDDAAQDAGIGDMVQLTVDAANMMEAVGELEADEWRNSILWDHVRNTVDNKAFSELARRGRIVPGPRFEGNVARDPAEARAPAAAA
ncbi:hypothetical protein SO694_00178011 [Aureococcus anophagefferens]|uniref:Uncharacterized protein n=2 Tax=Aureococcus anophagefferens TaxID=44056 RepID=A0ABR1FZE4_AURAN|nr:hypothetical protein AURANDRAFT_63136 [Aureococcus anophagefferens]EGB09788.1 hypothetical protein AURANDRAFT_63136 [Aureococcus anophagefferens]|eukprot:XP_009035823.1 hypothetical protein AURANDRAFT_63136 [Aureococcus anophagefferens]